MSFPPRPPLMPGMMVPPFGPYPPMGMMPMGMMPVMRPGMSMPMSLPRPTTPAVISAKPELNFNKEKLPVTTVFVGNIHDKAPDSMIKLMLQKCGNVLSWKRVQGASGKLQAFGFCEYDNPESTLRCIRLLNDWNIIDKKLLVKVDAKTNNLLDDYKQKKELQKKIKLQQQQQQCYKTGGSDVKEDGENSDDDDEIDVERKKDDEVKQALSQIMKDNEGELSRSVVDGGGSVLDDPEKRALALKIRQQQQSKQEDVTQLNLSGMDLEEDIKQMVNKEIRSFRDTHLNSESSKDDKHGRDHRDREGSSRSDREKERERERMKRREEERTRERERNREREEYEREKRDRERERERERMNKSRSKTRDRSPAIVILDKRSRDRDVDADDEEEMYERKKLERKLREKEAAYQELLRKWESRERKKGREHERDRVREKERRMEETKEAKRLREFLEDYNDQRDDVKYYKGSALQRRLNERQKEVEADERDRQKEREELEEIRNKLREEGHPDLELEMARIEREREEHLLPRIPNPAHMSPTNSDSPVIVLDPDNNNNNNNNNNNIDNDDDDDDDGVVIVNNNSNNFMSVSLRPINSAPNVSLDGEGGAGRNKKKNNNSNVYSPTNNANNSDDDDDDDDDDNGMVGGDDNDYSQSSNVNNINESSNPPNLTGFSNSLNYNSEDSMSGPPPVRSSSRATTSNSATVNNANVFNRFDSSNTNSPFSPQQQRVPTNNSRNNSGKRKKPTVSDVFNNDDDDDDGVDGGKNSKKRRLVPLDYEGGDDNDDERGASTADVGGNKNVGLNFPGSSSSSSVPTTAEEKRRWIKNFIDRIPVTKDELFAWQVDWSLVDTELIDKRIRPWVNKKIIEYIGEDEPSLTDFICKKILSNIPPATILADISMVLDDEAEVFVMKMWRLLVYEIEAKKFGVIR